MLTPSMEAGYLGSHFWDSGRRGTRHAALRVMPYGLTCTVGKRGSDSAPLVTLEMCGDRATQFEAHMILKMFV